MWKHLNHCAFQLVEYSFFPVNEGWIVLFRKGKWCFQICSNLQVVFCSVISLPICQIGCHQETTFGSEIAGLALNFIHLLSAAVLRGGKTHMELVGSSVILWGFFLYPSISCLQKLII